MSRYIGDRSIGYGLAFAAFLIKIAHHDLAMRHRFDWILVILTVILIVLNMQVGWRKAGDIATMLRNLFIQGAIGSVEVTEIDWKTVITVEPLGETLAAPIVAQLEHYTSDQLRLGLYRLSEYAGYRRDVMSFQLYPDYRSHGPGIAVELYRLPAHV